MLSVEVRRRGSVTLGSAMVTAEVTATLVVAHTIAGGDLPSAPWIALMAGSVFLAGLLVLRGAVRPIFALPALVAAQLGLHLWLAALTPAAHDHEHAMAGAHHHAHGHLGLGMLLAHVVAAVVTAVAWELRRRAVDVLVSWSEPLWLPVSVALDRLVAAQPSLGISRRVLVDARRRGPPVGVLAA